MLKPKWIMMFIAVVCSVLMFSTIAIGATNWPEKIRVGLIPTEGGADVYPRLGPTSEWDTAAAQAVVEQAGGAVLELDGKPLAYNAKEDILNPHFLVRGPDDRDWLALLAETA